MKRGAGGVAHPLLLLVMSTAVSRSVANRV